MHVCACACANKITIAVYSAYLLHFNGAHAHARNTHNRTLTHSIIPSPFVSNEIEIEAKHNNWKITIVFQFQIELQQLHGGKGQVVVVMVVECEGFFGRKWNTKWTPPTHNQHWNNTNSSSSSINNWKLCFTSRIFSSFSFSSTIHQLILDDNRCNFDLVQLFLRFFLFTSLPKNNLLVSSFNDENEPQIATTTTPPTKSHQMNNN